MPKDARMLRRAAKENWPPIKVAEQLDTDNDNADALLAAAQMAIEVRLTGSPAESFRKSVRRVVQHAVKTRFDKPFDKPNAIDKLVTQICYRVSDVSCLLDTEDGKLSDSCKELRRESHDVEFYGDEDI